MNKSDQIDIVTLIAKLETLLLCNNIYIPEVIINEIKKIQIKLSKEIQGIL